jgi:hypothetical protein
MHEQLLGYLLGALEPDDVERLEARLAQDAELREALAVLKRSLTPLAEDDEECEPPAGLSQRTCRFVALRRTRDLVDRTASKLEHLRLQDLVVAAGICLAAALLFMPALSQSRFQARLMGCQNNLRSLGLALLQYSQHHKGNFPEVPTSGPLAAAGIYGPTLWESGFLESADSTVCPASSLSASVSAGSTDQKYRLPKLAELKTAPPATLQRLHATMGGSYGYSLGYVQDGAYHSNKNRGRSTFALMADTPHQHYAATDGDGPHQAALRGSNNHGCCGQNVLFEDGHVRFLNACHVTEAGDDIYQNVHGYVGAGIGPDDSVIGSSSARPILFKNSLDR